MEDGRVLWSYHVNMRAGPRAVSRGAVLRTLETLEVIELYPPHQEIPRCLVLGWFNGWPVHARVALDEAESVAHVVFAYQPDPARWSPDFRRRTVGNGCHQCGGALSAEVTDMPFKLGLGTIVIVKNLPLQHCHECGAYALEDPVMARVEALLSSVDGNRELEIVTYAA